MSRATRFSARLAVVAAAIAVAAAAVAGRHAIVTVEAGATSFLLLVAGLGALVFVLALGEFPQRIGRDIVEFSVDDARVTATALRR
jgi:hypothetical protein